MLWVSIAELIIYNAITAWRIIIFKSFLKKIREVFFPPKQRKLPQKRIEKERYSVNWVKAGKKAWTLIKLKKIISGFVTWQPSIPLATRNFRNQEDNLNTVHYGLFLTSYTHAFSHTGILWQEMKKWKKWQVRFKNTSVIWLKEISSCIFWLLILTDWKAFFSL